jgi:hypothetical protein
MSAFQRINQDLSTQSTFDDFPYAKAIPFYILRMPSNGVYRVLAFQHEFGDGDNLQKCSHAW